MLTNPTQSIRHAHSADVHMSLTVNGQTMKIGQMGPRFLLVRKPIDCPPTDGEVFLSIDGHEQRWRVHLPKGISAAEPRIEIGKPLE